YADREGFLLVLPEATRPDARRPASFLDNPQVWNDSAAHAEPARPPVNDVGFVAAVLDDVSARFAIDPTRVYLTGFSDGGAVALPPGGGAAGAVRPRGPGRGVLPRSRPAIVATCAAAVPGGTARPLGAVRRRRDRDAVGPTARPPPAGARRARPVGGRD